MQEDHIALKIKILSKYFQILDWLYRENIISFISVLFYFSLQSRAYKIVMSYTLEEKKEEGLTFISPKQTIKTVSIF